MIHLLFQVFKFLFRHRWLKANDKNQLKENYYHTLKLALAAAQRFSTRFKIFMALVRIPLGNNHLNLLLFFPFPYKENP